MLEKAEELHCRKTQLPDLLLTLTDRSPEKKSNQMLKIKLLKTKDGKWFGAETSLDATFR